MKVSAKQYARTLYSLTQDKDKSEIDNLIVQFVSYVKRSGDMNKSQDVLSQFNNIYNEEHNIVDATITTARDLNINEQERVRSFVCTKYGAESVVVHNVIDKSIKGGIVIRVGDEVLDGSVSGRLKQLKDGLKH